MAVQREARTPRTGAKQLSHLLVKEGHDGGHIVEHHYESAGMNYHPPKEYVFGEDEGHEMLAHVAKHMNVKIAETPKEPEAPEEEGHQPGDGEYYVESAGAKGDRPYPHNR